MLIKCNHSLSECKASAGSISAEAFFVRAGAGTPLATKGHRYLIDGQLWGQAWQRSIAARSGDTRIEAAAMKRIITSRRTIRIPVRVRVKTTVRQTVTRR